MSMRLGDLVAAVSAVVSIEPVDPQATLDAVVQRVVHDSRQVRRGDVFCCVRGLVVDGHDYVAEAIQAGAEAVVVDRAYLDDRGTIDAAAADRTDVLVTDDTRHAMAHLAMTLAGNPGRRLRVVGITGTNGKTTTAQLLASILATAGVAVEVIGTLTGARTTPESTDLAPRLAAIADGGGDVVVMEVSSHALDQHRVDGVGFTLALFTNLTQDHLDYHETMDEYFAAKAKLFTPERSATGIVLVDGPYGARLLESATIDLRPLSVDSVEILEVDADHVRFGWRDHRVHLPLGGLFNVENALLAAEAARELGVNDQQIVEGLARASAVPGRFETVPNDLGIAIVVDYAHTPDGLDNVLRSARTVAGSHRVSVVFGCGGDRDRAKRRVMGSLAEALADDIIVTSDNPRSEPPEAIIADIVAGMHSSPQIEQDRRAAIHRAVAAAHPGDVVVIAGKGHETTQTIGADILPFDDRLVAAEAAAQASAGGRS